MFNERFTFGLFWWNNVRSDEIDFDREKFPFYFVFDSHEAMTDLVAIMNSLVDGNGRILIDGMYDEVAPLTADEEKLYEKITFDTVVLWRTENRYFANLSLLTLFKKAYCQEAGVGKTIQSEKEKILMHRWRFPSLSLHGIQGAFDGVGCKTVIPRHVIGKFSIRIVPNMKISSVESLVEKYVNKIAESRQTPNKISVKLEHGGDYWLADPTNDQYRAARNATIAVHGIDPDLTREGGSIPITRKFHSNKLERKTKFFRHETKSRKTPISMKLVTNYVIFR